MTHLAECVQISETNHSDIKCNILNYKIYVRDLAGCVQISETCEDMTLLGENGPVRSGFWPNIAERTMINHNSEQKGDNCHFIKTNRACGVT